MPPDPVTAPVVPWIAGAIGVAAVSHGYLWSRLVRRSDVRRAGTALLVGLAALLPLGMTGLLYMRVLSRGLARPLMTAAFTYTGVLFFLLLALLACDVILLVAPRARPRLGRWRPAVGLGCAVALSAAAIAQAGRAPAVTEHRVVLPSLPPELEGLRLVHLSDLHVGPTLGRAFVEDLVARTNALAPDLVVITGDVVDGSVAALGEELAPLRGLRARDGVYLVLGNHEYLSGADAWTRRFGELGLRVLRNQSVPLRGAATLVGLDDAEGDGLGDAPIDVEAAFAGQAPGRFTIVAAHEPETVARSSARGAALQLSGHTHGGQIFPLHVLAWLDQRYLAGLYTVGPTQLHVSAGAGYWGPPMRLGSRGEISLLVLARR